MKKSFEGDYICKIDNRKFHWAGMYNSKTSGIEFIPINWEKECQNFKRATLLPNGKIIAKIYCPGCLTEYEVEV